MKLSKFNKGIATLWLIIAGFVLIAGSVWWYYVDDIKPKLTSGSVVCAKDTAQCPDSSYVSRINANDCRLAACPDVTYLNTDKYKGWSIEQMKKHCADYLGYFSNIGPRCEFQNVNNNAMAIPPPGRGKQGWLEKLINFIPNLFTAKNKPSGAGGNFQSEQKQIKDVPDTSTWETYRNEKYGFEFEYPENWKAKYGEPDRPDLKVLGRVTNSERAGKPDTDTPIEQFLIRSYDYSCKGTTKNIWRKTVIDTGWSTGGMGEINYRELCILSDSWPIVLTFSAFDDSSKLIMDKILSTFKFIK